MMNNDGYYIGISVVLFHKSLSQGQYLIYRHSLLVKFPRQRRKSQKPAIKKLRIRYQKVNNLVGTRSIKMLINHIGRITYLRAFIIIFRLFFTILNQGRQAVNPESFSNISFSRSNADFQFQQSAGKSWHVPEVWNTRTIPFTGMIRTL